MKKVTNFNSNFLYLLRIISAWMVVTGHAMSMFQVTVFKDQSYFPYMQNVAVIILFFISGYFTMPALKKIYDNGKEELVIFVRKRFLRIYSCYLPALLVTAILDKLYIYISASTYSYYENFNLYTFVGNLLMLQDHPLFETFRLGKFTVTSFGSGRPYWTLAVEWWLYLGSGYTVYLLHEMKNRNIFFSQVVFAGVLCIVPIYNLIGGRGNGLSLVWFLGAISYEFCSMIKINKKMLMFWGMVVSSTFWNYSIYRKEAYDVVFMLLLISIIVLVLAFGESEYVRGISSSKVLRFVSKYTYSLYLTHYGILKLWTVMNQARTSVSRILLGIIIAHVFAIVFACAFENRKVIKYFVCFGQRNVFKGDKSENGGGKEK